MLLIIVANCLRKDLYVYFKEIIDQQPIINLLLCLIHFKKFVNQNVLNKMEKTNKLYFFYIYIELYHNFNNILQYNLLDI